MAVKIKRQRQRMQKVVSEWQKRKRGLLKNLNNKTEKLIRESCRVVSK